jgi:mitogen-activated protein kinase kinase kinase ANP1
MGSGCCKVVDDFVDSSKVSLIRTQYIKEFNDLTINESFAQPFDPILWQRGDLIGEGVFGKVYQGMNLNTGELLAIKTYQVSSDAHRAEREILSIKSELNILKSLDHPNIIKYFQADYDPETNLVNILMEYIPSGPMNALITKYKSFSEPVIRNYTKQLLEGLAYLHSNEIIHRDLKSANILITEDSRLKLSDFGCSRRFDSRYSSQSKSFKGSPYWMAPELATGGWHSYPADIWSLGCLVIEMASGAPPWSNYSNRSREVLKLIATPDNLPIIPKVSEELSNFILRCLQRDPSQRPTAKDLLNDKFVKASYPNKCYDIIRLSTINIVRDSMTEENLIN